MNVPVTPMKGFSELFDVIRSCKWVQDGPKTLGDVFSHPGYIQHVINQGGERKIGDCLSEDTLLMRAESPFMVKISEVNVGELIYCSTGWTKVLTKWDRGVLPIVHVKLDNGSMVNCTTDHRFFTFNANEKKEVKAGELKPGDRLYSIPQSWRETRVLPQVVSVESGGTAHVYDIETESGDFYLPYHDIVVHNCDEFAVYNAAAIEASKKAQTWKDTPVDVQIMTVFWQGEMGKIGGHNVCLIKFPDGKYSCMDYGYPWIPYHNSPREVAQQVCFHYGGEKFICSSIRRLDLSLVEVCLK